MFPTTEKKKDSWKRQVAGNFTTIILLGILWENGSRFLAGIYTYGQPKDTELCIRVK